MAQVFVYEILPQKGLRGGTISRGFSRSQSGSQQNFKVLDIYEQYIFVDQFELYGRTDLIQRILNCARSLVLCWLWSSFEIFYSLAEQTFILGVATLRF